MTKASATQIQPRIPIAFGILNRISPSCTGGAALFFPSSQTTASAVSKMVAAGPIQSLASMTRLVRYSSFGLLEGLVGTTLTSSITAGDPLRQSPLLALLGRYLNVSCNPFCLNFSSSPMGMR